jgi:long-chain acyl-CoA synthetase
MSLTLNQLLEDKRISAGSSPALIFKDRIYTYAQLADAVDRCAQGLWELGVRPGDKFGLAMRNNPEYVITYFALMRIAAVAVPVNFLLKPEEMSYIFEHSDCVGIITQPACLDNVREAVKYIPGVRNIVLTGQHKPGTVSFDDLLKSNPFGQETHTTPETLAMLIYTSGTTGKPKGVMLTHGNLTSNVQAIRMAIQVSSRDSFICILPMFHAFGWTACVLLPVALGSRIVIMESIQPFGDVLKSILKWKVNIFIAVPPVYSALVKMPFWGPMKIFNPLRICVSGAAPLSPELLVGFERKFGVPLLEGYGLTETSPAVSFNPLDGQRKPGTVGPPIPGVMVKIVDDSGSELALGKVGEICINGPNVMMGYYKQPEDTEASFLSGNWLKTGDLGMLDSDGYITIVDRLKDLIIVKGLNVYPREVEEVLLRHRDVAEAAVVGIRDETGDETVKAFIVPRDLNKIDKSVIHRHCLDHLAAYKCPREIEVVEELPKNTIGKVLRRELRAASA